MKAVKVYVASSWRNEYYPAVVQAILDAGHEVYDFRNTKPGGGAFNWDQIDPKWESWTHDEYLQALEHPLTREAFASDSQALNWADTLVMVLPCGASAHTEFGYAIGAGKYTAVLMDEGRPELMYHLATSMFSRVAPLLKWLSTLKED